MENNDKIRSAQSSAKPKVDKEALELIRKEKEKALKTNSIVKK